MPYLGLPPDADVSAIPAGGYAGLPPDADIAAPQKQGIPQERDPFSYSQAETAKMQREFVQKEAKPESALKTFGRQALKGIGMGFGGVAGTVAGNPITGIALGGGLGKGVGDVVFGDKPFTEADLPPEAPKGANIAESMAVGLKRLPTTLPRSLTNIATMPYDMAKSVTTPATQGDVGGAVSAVGDIAKGLVTFPLHATGISDVYRNVTEGNAPFSDMRNVQTMIEEDPAGLLLGLEMGAKGAKAVSSGTKTVKSALKGGSTRYEKEAGKYFLEQQPEKGSYLEKEAQANQARAQQLQEDTGAKLTLDQQTGLNTQIGGKKALLSADARTKNMDQTWREENLKLVEKMINDVGGNMGDVGDVRKALQDALAVRRDQVKMAETGMAEAETGLGKATTRQKITKQRQAEDLYRQQTQLEEALQRAEAEHAAQVEQRQGLLDQQVQRANEQGKGMLAGSAGKDVIGADARTRAEEAGKAILADIDYGSLAKFDPLEVDHAPLDAAAKRVAAQHPADFRTLLDGADKVTQDIFRRLMPEEGSLEPQFSSVLDAQGKPVPLAPSEPSGITPLTVGELRALSAGVGNMRRAANASASGGQRALAKSLGDIQEGIMASMETAREQAAPQAATPVRLERSLLGDIAKSGGINAESLNRFGDKNKRKVGNGDSSIGIIRKDGVGVDQMAQQMSEAGWQIPKDIYGNVDVQAFMDMLEPGGKRPIHPDAEGTALNNAYNEYQQQALYNAPPELSPAEQIKAKNKRYREEYVPLFRDPSSPAVKILKPNIAGMDKVKDARVMDEFFKDGSDGIYSGQKYKEVYGNDTTLAHDYAVRDLLDTAFGELKGEWSPSVANGWLRKKAYALKEMGIYDDISRMVKDIPDMAELKNRFPEPTTASKTAAETNLRNFKNRIGNAMSATGKLDESALPEYGLLEEAKQVLRSRQESLKALERSPIGDMVTGDWESTIKNFAAAAKGNYADSVKLVMDTLKDNPHAQEAFKSAFAEHLYSKWLADAQKTMGLENSPTPAKAGKATSEFAPALKELYGEAGFAKIEQAKEILDSMARSQKNTVSGSETHLFGNSGRYKNMNRAIAMLAIAKIPGTNWSVGTWAGSKITAKMQSKFDAVLSRGYFDTEYAAKLVDIAQKSQKASVKVTARRLAGLLKDDRGLMTARIAASGNDPADKIVDQ